MTDLIFDPPWYLPVGIAALGIYLFVHGNRRQQAKLRGAGLGVLALAVALFTAGYFLDTDREKAEKGTRALIDAVERHDWDKMRSLLDDSASVSVPRGPVYGNRDLIIGGAQAATEQYGVSNIRTLSMQSKQDASGIVTIDIDVLSDQKFTGQMFPTSWQFEWHEFSDGWKIVNIVCLKIGQETGEGLGRQFPSPKR
jgi:hypothetical protein